MPTEKAKRISIKVQLIRKIQKRRKKMKILIFLALISAISSSSDFVQRRVYFEKNETLLRENGRLAGGDQAGNTDFPFVADFTTFWPGGSMGSCTGSIIASFIVMTSRDCML